MLRGFLIRLHKSPSRVRQKLIYEKGDLDRTAVLSCYTQFKTDIKVTFNAQWIRLHLPSAAPGSSPKHGIYALSFIVKFVLY